MKREEKVFAVWESIKHLPTTESSTKGNLKSHLPKVNFLAGIIIFCFCFFVTTLGNVFAQKETSSEAEQ